jgi:hypothetical protein
MPNTRTLAIEPFFTVQREVPGWETYGYTLWGLGEICARQTCRNERQTAAHGQITERKPSVAHFRFSFHSHLSGYG